MFKAVLQESRAALKELAAVLLHKEVSEIREFTLENPIILGDSVSSKTVILDILLTLSTGESLNIEMQVISQQYWKERSLLYLCRSFGQINKGSDYDEVRPAYHVGILDFELFQGEHRLYSENVLMDKITNRQYSDKLAVNVLCLKCLEDATEEERRSGIYHWAKFFAAKTWEELKMAAESEAMQEAIGTMRKLTEDEKIRRQCQAREDFERDQRSLQNSMRRQMERQMKQMEEMKRQTDAMKQQADAAKQMYQEAKEKRKEEEEKRKEAEERKRAAEEKQKKAEGMQKKAEEGMRALLALLEKNPALTAEEILKRIPEDHECF